MKYKIKLTKQKASRKPQHKEKRTQESKGSLPLNLQLKNEALGRNRHLVTEKKQCKTHKVMKS